MIRVLIGQFLVDDTSADWPILGRFDLDSQVTGSATGPTVKYVLHSITSNMKGRLLLNSHSKPIFLIVKVKWLNIGRYKYGAFILVGEISFSFRITH